MENSFVDCLSHSLPSSLARHAQVLKEQLEYEGAPMHLEPKLDFMARKKLERQEKGKVGPAFLCSLFLQASAGSSCKWPPSLLRLEIAVISISSKTRLRGFLAAADAQISGTCMETPCCRVAVCKLCLQNRTWAVLTPEYEDEE